MTLPGLKNTENEKKRGRKTKKPGTNQAPSEKHHLGGLIETYYAGLAAGHRRCNAQLRRRTIM